MLITLKYILLFQDNIVYFFKLVLFMRKLHYCAFPLKHGGVR